MVPLQNKKNKREILFAAFREVIIEFSNGTTIGRLFAKLKTGRLDKLQIMIVDSALKEIPLETLWKTLLIPEQKYYSMIEDAIVKMTNMIEDKPEEIVNLEELSLK